MASPSLFCFHLPVKWLICNSLLQTPLFSSSGGHGSHQQLGHLYVDLPSTNLPGDHSNGITPIATQAIEYGGPLIDPPSYIEPLTSWGSHIGEISYPVPQHTVPSNRIPQQNPPLGPHMQTISMADALGYDVLGRHNGGASHGSPQYDTQVKCHPIYDLSSHL